MGYILEWPGQNKSPIAQWQEILQRDGVVVDAEIAPLIAPPTIAGSAMMKIAPLKL
ncbi:MAG: hypothetical protein ACFB0G_12190 [Leptolyngbyaceae cyanobacterium]